MYLNNIFGEIPEKHVTFVIDTSGSMYDVLSTVKDHIIEVLIERAHTRPDTSFNIIDYNSEVLSPNRLFTLVEFGARTVFIYYNVPPAESAEQLTELAEQLSSNKAAHVELNSG